jgi:hypothetical protein
MTSRHNGLRHYTVVLTRVRHWDPFESVRCQPHVHGIFLSISILIIPFHLCRKCSIQPPQIKTQNYNTDIQDRLKVSCRPSQSLRLRPPRPTTRPMTAHLQYEIPVITYSYHYCKVRSLQYIFCLLTPTPPFKFCPPRRPDLILFGWPNQEDETGGACGTYWGEMHIGFWWGKTW